MCTVSYLPLPDGALICSNRDESKIRSAALAPAWYQVNGSSLLFPRDPDASGTWIAMKPTGEMGVLLNGAWSKHNPAYPYRKSRGLVMLELCARQDLLSAFEDIQLHNIEPFTVIFWQKNQLQENRWDGTQKYSRMLPANEPRIWSSVTLYDPVATAEREAWFQLWLTKQQSRYSAASVQAFHASAGSGNPVNDLKMNRNDEQFTVSITCMEWQGEQGTMFYNDLQTGVASRYQLNDAITYAEMNS